MTDNTAISIKKVGKFQIAGAIFTAIIGTLFHFLYDFTDQNVLAGIFSPVNESVWEHLKLLFFPILIFGIIEFAAYGKDLDNFIPVKIVSAYIAIVFVVVFYYSYTAIAGKNISVLDIGSFFVAVALAYVFSYFTLKNQKVLSDKVYRVCAIILLVLTFAAFVVYTFIPPHTKIFADPENGTYGIPKK